MDFIIIDKYTYIEKIGKSKYYQWTSIPLKITKIDKDIHVCLAQNYIEIITKSQSFVAIKLKKDDKYK